MSQEGPGFVLLSVSPLVYYLDITPAHLYYTQIITKEIEANEWKKKYEETRQEVLEMRLDWRFGEVWIPLCITIINANEVMKVLS